MRALSRTLVCVTTAVGIAVGGLATAGPGVAADAKPAVSAEAVTPLAVVNFGLTIEEAKKVQRVLRDHWGYTDKIDGQLGTNSWMAMQRFLKKHWGYTDKIDGDPGPNTVMALQRWLQAKWGYDGEIDGDPGPKTRAAFKRMANACPNC
ncbi:peptidoglycan-binding protein [Streptomyces tuirus]|uniref:Peptidoglycan-binding protein n=1 Tax=Streptomyces tuirus TaxID=68278 RepID=A0A941FMG3_9ACTN|nr:peptidoglycan-binding protein [Streptomyces tuirus]